MSDAALSGWLGGAPSLTRFLFLEHLCRQASGIQRPLSVEKCAPCTGPTASAFGVSWPVAHFNACVAERSARRKRPTRAPTQDRTVRFSVKGDAHGTTTTSPLLHMLAQASRCSTHASPSTAAGVVHVPGDIQPLLSGLRRSTFTVTNQHLPTTTYGVSPTVQSY